ncbi:hypothetical protein HAX54_028635 [Datura stramonium]|uniref:Uncharacterized protein n=1 Tax=Datura stramonium TaxID=4076 RepID=A0ABS8V7R9_DATST|nr:hypothetical protein [Datura stramonium]
MAQKVSKGKGVASSSHGRTRSIMSQEAPNKDPSIQPQPPRRYGLCRVTEQEVARWALHQQYGYHVSFPYAHISRKARIWLIKFCGCLVPEKLVTHVMRERVCLVYAFMIGMLVNVGVIIKDVLRRERVKKGERFSFGGLLTRFLRGNQINKEMVDYRPRYDPHRIDVKKTVWSYAVYW